MLSTEQVLKLVSSNEALQAQLDGLNEILAAREAELELLKKELAASVELRSRLDLQGEELGAMESLLAKKEQQAWGAEEREIGLQRELTDSARQQQAFEELKTNNRYLQTRYNDLEYELSEYKAHFLQLEAKARRAGELESHLSDALEQNTQLKKRLQELELLSRGR